MKRLYTLIVMLLSTLSAISTPSNEIPVNPSGFKIHRGMNLSHWLSQDFGWMPKSAWISENDIAYLAATGFDHVRLPIDEKEMWKEDGERIPEAFALVDNLLGWARDHGLRVVLDLHTIRTHHFNAENEGLENTLWTDPAAQKRFIDLWRDLSAHLKKYPVDQLAYELMNEPVADDHEDWNKLVEKTFAAIRELEPDRVIVIGSNRWQIPINLPHLRVPEGDKNIILSMHTYVPIPLTHYKASWLPLKDYDGPVQYPGKPLPPEAVTEISKTQSPEFMELLAADEEWNKDRLRQEIQPAVDTAKKLGLQLYCGEFGGLPTVDREDRLAYYRDIVPVFEENGMAW